MAQLCTFRIFSLWLCAQGRHSKKNYKNLNLQKKIGKRISGFFFPNISKCAVMKIFMQYELLFFNQSSENVLLLV